MSGCLKSAHKPLTRQMAAEKIVGRLSQMLELACNSRNTTATKEPQPCEHW